MLAPPEVGSHGHISLWLNSKDPNEEYVWENVKECACGRYSRDNGWYRWVVSEWMGRLNKAASTQPRTFGALAERWSLLA
jgi:hypothetical protein